MLIEYPIPVSDRIITFRLPLNAKNTAPLSGCMPYFVEEFREHQLFAQSTVCCAEPTKASNTPWSFQLLCR